MDNLVTIYHGGTVESDRYGYVEFLDMQSVPVLFNDRPCTHIAQDFNTYTLHLLHACLDTQTPMYSQSLS